MGGDGSKNKVRVFTTMIITHLTSMNNKAIVCTKIQGVRSYIGLI